MALEQLYLHVSAFVVRNQFVFLLLLLTVAVFIWKKPSLMLKLTVVTVVLAAGLYSISLLTDSVNLQPGHRYESTTKSLGDIPQD
ncbi:hypothetical protein [Desulforhopalus singaporensis]|uniref:Uncharacterized protein n=1 Tax=Desulforhopalus singaporensis TaxID=91360 RepID=A0A1H0UBI7_9BACT|nr:hypothetical protein [Desulforhopalus singaporensis]SDP63549.1 hypothetical protein SAMN05660330_03479 [Desulforhopalus singaporensis]